MIDFANLKYLTIPEGEVIEIRRGYDLLWQKPSEIKSYTELAYLESTGTQWIDTGIIPNNSTSLELIVSGVSDDSFSSSTGTWFLGARKAYLNNAFGFYYNQSTQNFYYASGNVMPNAFYSSASLYGNIRTIRLNSDGLYVDNAKVVSITSKAFTSPVPISLFGLNNDGSVISRTSFRCHSLKVWDGENLIRDMIPILDSDDVPCMYDKVSEEFFYNQGTGEFLYKTIKDEYPEVAFIESTGTEWIDTGYAINTSTDSVYLEFEALEDTKYKWLFGEHDDNARFGIGTGDGLNQRNIAYGKTTYKVKDTQIFDGKHIFSADSSGVYLDGSKIANYSSFKSTSSLYLFNLNLSGGSYQTKARVWKYQHYRNGELIRDMYPVLSKSINRAGLFDKVSMKFFGNNGSGEFQYSILPVEYKQVAFIESTGAQYINPNVQLTSNHSVEIDYQLINATQYRTGLFGGLGSNASARYGSILSPTNAYLEHGFGTGNIYWQQGKPDTNRHVLRQIKNKVYFDDNLLYTFAETTFSVGSAAYMCNFNYTNYKPAQARYYESKWWDGDVLIRHFIPCYRKEDGKAGFYDLINDVFYSNAGTGEFVYGVDEEITALMLANILDEEEINNLAGNPEVVRSEANPDETW